MWRVSLKETHQSQGLPQTQLLMIHSAGWWSLGCHHLSTIQLCKLLFGTVMYSYHMDQNPEEGIYSLNFKAGHGGFVNQWEMAYFTMGKKVNFLYWLLDQKKYINMGLKHTKRIIIATFTFVVVCFQNFSHFNEIS